MQDFLRPNFILFQENPRYSGVIPVFVFKDCRLSTGNCRLFGEISYFARIIYFHHRGHGVKKVICFLQS